MKLLKNTQSGHSILSKSFLSRMVQMRSCFLTTCTNKVHEDKNTKQMSRYAQETGRSMVEMLGVLAIIGVLSVGGIAGYSKAMFKYKLNQTLDVLSHALARLVEIDSLNMYRTEIVEPEDIIKYGIIPDCESKDGACQLPLNNVQLRLGLWGFTEGNEGVFQIRISGNNRLRLETCTAILSANLHEIYPDHWWNPIYTSSDGYDGTPRIRVSNSYVGDFYTKHPMPDNPELNTITPARIAEACKNCIAANPEIDLGYCMIDYTIGYNISL